ncbi:MAG: biotin--[acetyl-CoA-carboxylase] ligase [Candidatus Rokuibacteriota bacterium]|nr:MAG: biotin--[acetyl-CoA-carboxylase] ligase [Candidatus Rokubacteria bacterium]
MMARGSAAAEIVRLDTVDSTQSVAVALAERGAADRTVVVADQQLAGRGRRGRAWQAPAGTSLLASILVRPRLPQALLPTFSPTTAVATAEALRRLAPVAARVKWPNDVLIGGKKVAGILLESRARSATWHPGSGVSEPGRSSLRPPSVHGGLPEPATIIQGDLTDPATIIPATTIPATTIIIGIGVNLGQLDFPPELAGHATSVALETGSAPDRETMLAALLEEFDAWRGRLEREGFGPVRERWRMLSDTIGRHVTVDGVTGLAVDLDVDGALLIDVGGTVRRVIAGELAADDAGSRAPNR